MSNEAVIGQFNRLETDTGAARVEEDLAVIEGLCKPAIEKVIHRQDLTQEDGELIAMFSLLQERRTPRARQMSAELMEHMYRVAAELEVSTGTGVRDWLHGSKGREPTDDEIDALRGEILRDLREGRLVPQATRDHEVLSMFVATAEMALEIAAKSQLTCLHAIGAELVLSDNPVCMFDPTVPIDRGVGWMSSPATQVTFPISRDTCLLFRPGSPGYRHVDADTDLVADMNLRSYAFAEWSLYGSGQRWLQETRTMARRDRARVAEYSPHKRHLFFFESQQGEQTPHSVQVIEPTERIVRGFRPKDRPAPRQPAAQPISERLKKEWSRLVPDDQED